MQFQTLFQSHLHLQPYFSLFPLITTGHITHWLCHAFRSSPHYLTNHTEHGISNRTHAYAHDMPRYCIYTLFFQREKQNTFFQLLIILGTFLSSPVLTLMAISFITLHFHTPQTMAKFFIINNHGRTTNFCSLGIITTIFLSQSSTRVPPLVQS